MKTETRSKNETITIFKPGTVVSIGTKDALIIGIVTHVMIEGSTITYKVTWWCELERREAWLQEFEVYKHDSSELLKMNFYT